MLSCPENWPKGLAYASTCVAKEGCIEELRGKLKAEGSSEKVSTLIQEQRVHPHVKIEKITSALRYKGRQPHPLLGRVTALGEPHRGLFARKYISPGEELGEYVGVLSFLLRQQIFSQKRSENTWFVPFGAEFLVVDPSAVANELVFANDYHGIRGRPNAKPKQIVHCGCYYFGYITTEGIDAGEEIVLNYGENYRL